MKRAKIYIDDFLADTNKILLEFKTITHFAGRISNHGAFPMNSNQSYKP